MHPLILSVKLFSLETRLIFLVKEINALQGMDMLVESSTKAASRTLMPQADSGLLLRWTGSYTGYRIISHFCLG